MSREDVYVLYANYCKYAAWSNKSIGRNALHRMWSTNTEFARVKAHRLSVASARRLQELNLTPIVLSGEEESEEDSEEEKEYKEGEEGELEY